MGGSEDKSFTSIVFSERKNIGGRQYIYSTYLLFTLERKKIILPILLEMKNENHLPILVKDALKYLNLTYY
jgi:hypothetical protein